MDVLNDVVSSEDLQKFERKYYNQLKNDCITNQTKFEYAWCLVRSKYPADIKKGILLFEELCQEKDDRVRDYLYFLALGNARLKEYSQALTYCRKFLEIEPANQQAQELEAVVKNLSDKEGAIGMAITAGFAIVVFGAVSLGAILINKKN